MIRLFKNVGIGVLAVLLIIVAQHLPSLFLSLLCSFIGGYLVGHLAGKATLYDESQNS